MKIFTRVLLNKNKAETKQPPVITEKKPVEVISANDGIKFNKDGLPVEFTLNIHEITKKAFTPTAVYDEPAYYPWGEQMRHNSLHQNITTPEVVDGSIQVYNGYPVEMEVNGSKVIAINNCGDKYFSTTKEYTIVNNAGKFCGNGKITSVLDCNNYTTDVILKTQLDIFYLQLNKSEQ